VLTRTLTQENPMNALRRSSARTARTSAPSASSRTTPTRRTVLAGAAASASALALAACSSGASDAGSGDGSGDDAVPSFDPDAKTTITFMHAMASGDQKTALEKIVSDFGKDHPNVTIELQDQPDYGTLQTKTKAQVGAGSAPTIAQAYGNWASEYADSKVIVPLDAYAKTNEDYADFSEGVKKDMQLTDGKVWMWPFNKSVVVVYRNAEMVKEEPKTWDDFAAVCKDTSKDGVVALSIDPGSAKGPAGGTALYEILAESMGSTVFADDGTPQFSEDGCVKALEYLVDLKEAGALAIASGYPGQEALGAEKGAFDISSVASFPFNEQAVGGKFEMGVSALPEGPSGAANQLAGTNIVLFADASDQERAAAWEFMQFITTPEQQASWAATTGYLPVSSASLDQDAMKKVVEERPWITDAVKQLDTARALPPVTSVTEASGLLSVALQDALQGKAKPADALADAQKKAAALK
jgi:multiple sugar transport system substrate-binding protein